MLQRPQPVHQQSPEVCRAPRQTIALTAPHNNQEQGMLARARQNRALTAPPATVTRAESAVPRAMRRYLALDDFEATARRRIPKFLYGYISGGAETDAAVRDNRKAFDEYGFVPRVLNDVSGRDQTTTLFGKTYASPFGIPPMGSSALCAYRGDIVLTRAAAAENVPMILSASSLITLEDVRARKSRRLVSGLSGRPARAHRAAGRPRGRGRLRHLRRHRRRAGAAEPREQHPQRLSGAAGDHAAGGLGHGRRIRTGCSAPGRAP